VADVAEALIGAAVITGGIESALKISKDLGCYLPRVDRWSDFGRKVLAPPPEWTAELSHESLLEMEELVGCTISKPHIMAQALVSGACRNTAKKNKLNCLCVRRTHLFKATICRATKDSNSLAMQSWIIVRRS
jgi:hypothetical protein